MTPVPTPYPYAALAVISHVFETVHLDINVVFRFSMDQTVKPAHDLWICEVNDIEEAVTASTWLDAWTLQLTIADIGSLPIKVTLEYDGPSKLLVTTWDKQWEPWGPILSFDGSLLPYGNFFGSEIGWEQVAAQGAWYDITDEDIALNGEHNMLFQNNGEIKILAAGWHIVNCFLTIDCSIANKHVLTGIGLNHAAETPGITHHEFGRAGEEHSLSTSCLLLLAVNDIVTVGVETPDTGDPTLKVDHIGLTVLKIGQAG